MSAGLLDLRDLRMNGAVCATACREFLEALVVGGFATVVGHGILNDSFRAAHEVFDEFLALPEHVRYRYADPQLHEEVQRSTVFKLNGYAWGDPLEPESPPHDPTQIWYAVRETDPVAAHDIDRPVHRWPAEVPRFRAVVLDLFRQLDECAQTLLTALGEAIREPELATVSENGWAMLRLLHYPPPRPETPPGSLLSRAHEDIGFLTLYAGATAEGLDLLLPTGEWHAVPIGGEEMIVAAGVMLRHATNGLVQPVTHRVRYATEQVAPRKSTPFAIGPRLDERLTPLGSAVRLTGGVPRYAPLTAADILDAASQRKSES